MRDTTEAQERAGWPAHALAGRARKVDAETKCVCVDDDAGLAARGSYEPADTLGGVLTDLNPGGFDSVKGPCLRSG